MIIDTDGFINLTYFIGKNYLLSCNIVKLFSYLLSELHNHFLNKFYIPYNFLVNSERVKGQEIKNIKIIRCI
jgi:hypothetical protein